MNFLTLTYVKRLSKVMLSSDRQTQAYIHTDRQTDTTKIIYHSASRVAKNGDTSRFDKAAKCEGNVYRKQRCSQPDTKRTLFARWRLQSVPETIHFHSPEGDSIVPLSRSALSLRLRYGLLPSLHEHRMLWLIWVNNKNHNAVLRFCFYHTRQLCVLSNKGRFKSLVKAFIVHTMSAGLQCFTGWQ